MDKINVTWLLENSDKLGTLPLLIIAIIGLLYFTRSLYKQSRECEKARLDDAHERAVMNKELGELKGKVDAMHTLHQQHLSELMRVKLKDD